MKARLFSGLDSVEEELFFKVKEEADDVIWVSLVKRDGEHVQYLFSFGQEGIIRSSLNDRTAASFDTELINAFRFIKVV